MFGEIKGLERKSQSLGKDVLDFVSSLRRTRKQIAEQNAEAETQMKRLRQVKRNNDTVIAMCDAILNPVDKKLTKKK